MPGLHDAQQCPLPLPRVLPGESVDILTFVVTRDGWEALKDRIGLLSENRVRLLTKEIKKSAKELMDQTGIRWHCLPRNHAKVILYHAQKFAMLGSFNITYPSLCQNIECFEQVNGENYCRLAERFEQYWEIAEQGRDGQVELDRNAVKPDQDLILQPTVHRITQEQCHESWHEAQEQPDELLSNRRNPWPFQEKIIKEVLDWLDTTRDGDLGRIVKLPTGAGKTLVAAEAIRGLIERKPQARILWVCHRVELLRQSWELVRVQIDRRIPDAQWFVPWHVKTESMFRDKDEFLESKDRQMVFCTQGMLSHLLNHNRRDRFDLVVVDESHRFHPESTAYKQLYKYCCSRGIPRLGLTATPLAFENRGFGRYWNTDSLFGKDVSRDWLEQEGYLCRLNKNLSRVWPTGYAFRFGSRDRMPSHRESELLTRIHEFNREEVNQHVVKAWREYRDKRQRILCFAVSIEHVKTLVTRHFRSDPSMRAIHSELPPGDNRKNLDWFNDNAAETRTLVSVLMATEGLDLPLTDCLLMVRPTFSRTLHSQMIGRGLRGPKAGGSEDCAIVDFTYQFLDAEGRPIEYEPLQITADIDRIAANAETAPEEDEDPDDLDASGQIWTVGDLKKAVDQLCEENGVSIQAACRELAKELDYSAATLVNYYYTKSKDYPLGWEDLGLEGEVARSAVYVTRNNLQDLRIDYPESFAKIASLTNVVPGTLQVYCSDQEKFERWKANNKDKMDRVRDILASSFSKHGERE